MSGAQVADVWQRDHKQSRGKRKANRANEDEHNTDPVHESPRKKKLHDAFKTLSIARGTTLARHLAEASDAAMVNNDDMGDADTQMREPASYNKDAHTVVITTLEDDSDVEPEEPRFLFNMPGSIDNTFGTTGIPAGLDLNRFLNRGESANSQLVLYKGKPEEIIAKTMNRPDIRAAERPKQHNEHDADMDGNEMELD